MKQILESIEHYAASLEQRLAALESAASVLQTQLSLYQTKTQEQANVIASLEARIAALEDELNNIEWVADEELQPQEEELPEPAAETEELPAEAPAETPLAAPVEALAEEVAAPEEEPVPAAQPAPAAPIAQEPQEQPAPVTPAQVEPSAPLPAEPQETQPQVSEEPAPAPAPAAQEAPKANLYGKPVDDIKQAIALGDRFLFQRELFKQNAEQMQRTFVDINALHSFDEAVAYLDKRFDWDKDSNTYALFLTALHRRFPQ